MFKYEISYTDFNDQVRTETLYFNLSRMDALELVASYPEGYDKYLKRVVAEGDSKKIVDEFTNFVKMTYGVKSEDGTRFLKSDELTRDFVSSAAYDEFMMELVSNEQLVVTFIGATIPKNLDLKKPGDA